MASFQYYDPKYLCLCGMHVEKASLLVAALNAVGSYMFAMASAFEWNFYGTAIMFSWGVLFSLVIWGHRVRKPALFLPYLIVQAIALLLGIILGSLFLMVTIVPNSRPPDILNHPRYRGGVRVVSLFAIGLVLILIGWLYSLIYRAYGFLKDQLASEALTKNQVDSERAQQNGFVPVAK